MLQMMHIMRGMLEHFDDLKGGPHICRILPLPLSDCFLWDYLNFKIMFSRVVLVKFLDWGGQIGMFLCFFVFF